MKFLLIIFMLFSKDLEKARELYEKGIYLEAMYYLDKYLKKKPNDKEAQNLKRKIISQLNSKDLIKGIESDHNFVKPKKVDKIIKKKKKNPSETLLNAQKAKEEGDYFKSLTLYENIFKKDTTNKKILYEIAQLSNWLGFFNKAIFYYEKYLSYFPKDKRAQYELALVYSWKGNYEKALHILKDLEKETSDIRIDLAKARIYKWQKDYEGAYKIYQKLKNSYPENEDILVEYEEVKGIIERERKKEEKDRIPYSFLPIFSYQQTSENWQRFLLKSSFQFNWDRLTATLFYEWQQCEEKETLRMINKMGFKNRINLLENLYFTFNTYFLAIKESDDLIIYGGGFNYQTPKLMLNLEYNKKPLWEEVYKINTCYRLITTDALLGLAYYQPFKFLGLEGSYQYGIYSDENELNNLNFKLIFLPLNNMRWGYHYYFLNYLLEKEEYWSPKFYEVHSIFFNVFVRDFEIFFQLGKPTDFHFLEKNFSMALRIKLIKDFSLLIMGRYGETYYYKIGEGSIGFEYLW
ncbi:MAG: tetratricopeptide repeat protein [candidate division WOR-3 bacterium]|nr:tetratricopeptide repeat protein [candidate division WOR-3 bacterium]MCX7836615.1 tetratricopeptide repeat protein [candidate division WOR-3 bacterium]MDW8113337.1 tetratricopeptide repeat protein [candidate division WOR-3 bacterium]